MKAIVCLHIAASAAAAFSLQGPAEYVQAWLGLYPLHEHLSSNLSSPRPSLIQTAPQCSPGYVFLEPRGWAVRRPGPVVLDGNGELVWTEHKFGEVMDFRPQLYKGETFLTFWRGTDDGTHGRGSYYMLDSAYEVDKIIRPAGGLDGDLHEFSITDNGTALMTIYEAVPADLSGVGGPVEGWVHDGILQEVDIETGKLVFEWRATSFYKAEHSLWGTGGKGLSKEDAWDYFHINSIDKDPEGNYYVSSRYTFTVTCISPGGEVLWQLGGVNSDFTDLSGGAASNFSWNHHVRWHEGNVLTIFDNGAHGYKTGERTAEISRGLLVQLDLTRMTVELITQFIRPQPVLSASQGSVQILDNGNVFVGWGYTPAYTEFTNNGTAICDVEFGAARWFQTGAVKSYRGFKGDWVGRPKSKPDIAGRRKQVYVSWNGATEVRHWRLQSAVAWDADENNFADQETIERTTFETMFNVAGIEGRYVRALALDASGEVLGISHVFDTKGRRIVSVVSFPSLAP